MSNHVIFTFSLEYYEILVTARSYCLLMKTTSVALGPHFEEFIQASITSGRYNNASEVVRSGLRLLEDQEQKIAALRAAIEEGMNSGFVEDFDFEAHLEELKAKRRNNG